ncbi:MAG: MFS transporter [Gammaproteobacteria bacterium]
MIGWLARRLALPRVVVVLSCVSLLNDSASEMITPLLPLFLTATLGAGPVVVGLIEGLAETASSVLKLVAGWLADRGWNAKRLVVAGYGLSNAARPLIALALGWSFVLALRVLDRIGKGIRTTPRDAMISAAVDERRRGHAFGFHRGMDHAGAVVGPLLAFAALGSGLDLAQVFLWSVLPGLAVMALLIAGVEHRQPVVAQTRPVLRWSMLDRRLRALVVTAAALAFASVPEAFLVLWANGHGVPVLHVPLLWAAAHVVKAVLAMFAGAASDRIGRLPVVVGGWCARVLLLAAIAFAPGNAVQTWILFLAYAGALACTEGAERALIGDMAPAQLRGTAFGIYNLALSLAALPGALVFGILWQAVSAQAAFLTSASLTAACAAFLIALSRRPGGADQRDAVRR